MYICTFILSVRHALSKLLCSKLNYMRVSYLVCWLNPRIKNLNLVILLQISSVFVQYLSKFTIILLFWSQLPPLALLKITQCQECWGMTSHKRHLKVLTDGTFSFYCYNIRRLKNLLLLLQSG